MKKIIAFVSSIILISSIISCKKDSPETWIYDLDEGKKYAQECDKNILLDFTAMTSNLDGISEPLRTNVYNDEFLKELSKEFVLVNLDYSNTLNAMAFSPDANPEELAQAQQTLENAKKNMEIVRQFSVDEFPTTLVLTKEGYVVSALNFYDIKESVLDNPELAKTLETKDIVDFYDKEKIKLALSEIKPRISEIRTDLEKIEKGTNEEKITAIDDIFDNTDFQYRYFLRDLSKKLIEIDPKNESGSVAKHFMSIIDSEAKDLKKDFVKISETYEKAADSEFLTVYDKQLMLYQSASFLYKSKENPEKIKELLTKSASIAPENEHTQLIKNMIEYLNIHNDDKN